MALSTIGCMAPVTHALGVNMSDDTMVFWEKFGTNMKEDKRTAIRLIGEELRDEWGCLVVGCMTEGLWRHDIINVIKKHGGNTQWIGAIEYLLGTAFKRMGTGVPESAALARQPLGTLAQSQNEERAPATLSATDPANRLGAFLTRTGQLAKVRLEPERVRALIVESKDLSRRLTFNDSKAISHYLWKITALKWNNFGNCVILFKHLQAEMHRIGIPYPNKGDWKSVATNRWEWCRKSRQQVLRRLPFLCARAPYPTSR